MCVAVKKSGSLKEMILFLNSVISAAGLKQKKPFPLTVKLFLDGIAPVSFQYNVPRYLLSTLRGKGADGKDHEREIGEIRQRPAWRHK